MPCPKCGRVVCDCTPQQRGQTHGQMMNDYYNDAGVSSEIPKPKEGQKPDEKKESEKKPDD